MFSVASKVDADGLHRYRGLFWKKPCCAIGLYYYLRILVTIFMMLAACMSRHKTLFDWSRTAGGVVLVLIAAAILFTGILPETMLEIVTLGEMQ